MEGSDEGFLARGRGPGLFLLQLVGPVEWIALLGRAHFQ